MSVNNTTTSCAQFNGSYYTWVAVVSSGTATISALSCITVIFLILTLKKHEFFIQRLVLYLSLAALFNSVSIILRLYRLGNSKDSDFLNWLCKAAAFIDQTTMWSMYMAFSVITFTLLMATVYHKSMSQLESGYFLIIFTFPPTFNWVPFYYDAYRKAGAWCWISTLNFTSPNCEDIKIGKILSLALWYVPSYTLIITLILIYTFIIIQVTRQRRRWLGKFDPDTERKKEQMRNEVWPLLFYPIGLFLLNIFPFTNRIHDLIDKNDPSELLWMLHAIFSPLQGGYIALVYTLDRSTLKRLSCANLRAALRGGGRIVVRDYPAGEDTNRDSASEGTAAFHNHFHKDEESECNEREPLLWKKDRSDTQFSTKV